MKRILVAAAAIAFALPLACADQLAPPEGAQVAISVAPLSLPSVTEATYELEVRNGDGDTVWVKTLNSQRYGDGAGSLSFVGPCDADSNRNTILLTLLSLEASGATLPPGSYENPGVLTREFDCVANEDVAIAFDITILRQANQGFFDVAVEFDNIYCSAKLDCQNDGAPLKLLFNNGVRDTTLVAAFACTSGRIGENSTLYRDDLTLRCAGNGTAVVNPDAYGNIDYSNGISGDAVLFGAAVHRGEENFDFDKLYWNVLLGLQPGMTSCVLETNATAARGYLDLMNTPEGNAYPFIRWQVNVTDANGNLVCDTHPVNGVDPHDGVFTEYVPSSAPRTFQHLYSPEGVPLQGAGTASDPYRWADRTGAASCLDYLNTSDPLYVPPATFSDGYYWIDTDGDGVGVEHLCDMTNGGWTRVGFDDFEGGQTLAALGWSFQDSGGAARSALTVAACGAWSNIVGGHGPGFPWDDGLGWNDSGEKTYSWANIAHTELRLDLDYITIDSWDGDEGGGVDEAWVATDIAHAWNSFVQHNVSFNGDTPSQQCGVVEYDPGTGPVQFLEHRIPISKTYTHATSDDDVVVYVGSHLNSSRWDESWGIDNVEIWVR